MAAADPARSFHALSDETRLRVVAMLAEGERCVCDLQDAVGAAQSRLSFHLKVLREAGLVSDRRQGRWVYYSLRRDALDGLVSFLAAQRPPEGASRCACGSGEPDDECCS